MQKKLLAVAFAGALAIPGVALAQSSVTISGVFKGSFENYKLTQSTRANTSQSGVADDSSAIRFNVREDLGGGLAAIAQLDVRFSIDNQLALGGTGNTHVGLQSKQWGRIFLGRQDLHYFNRESELTARGTLRADSVSLLAFVSPAGVGNTAIAGATRSTNVVHYTSPNWGGFTMIAAYSSNPAAAEADIGAAGAAGVRKGSAWNLNPNFAGKNFQVGYSYWRSKADGGAGNSDQRGDRLYGSYKWGGLKVGLAWDKSKLRTVAGATTADRTAWSLPASYSWGKHSIHGHYTKAGNDKTTAAADGAKMFALSYGYDLSKRTSAALTYAKITNDAGAAYTLFTTAAFGVGPVPTAGEDPRTLAVTLRHVF